MTNEIVKYTLSGSRFQLALIRYLTDLSLPRGGKAALKILKTRCKSIHSLRINNIKILSQRPMPSQALLPVWHEAHEMAAA